MAVRSRNAHWKMRDILRRHWLAMGARHGILSADGEAVGPLIDSIVERTPAVIAAVSERLPPGVSAGLAGPILHGLQAAADRLAG